MSSDRSRCARLIALPLLCALLIATGPLAVADEPPEAPLGIGFLWYGGSEEAAALLGAETDFVDLILGQRHLAAFEQIPPPVRIMCLSLALERHDARPFPGIKETIEMLQANSIDPERVIIGYNPERSPGTTTEEMDNLVESVQRAKEMADSFGSPLLVGPGMREMLQQEHLYSELARHSDMWLIQTQRFQLDQFTRRVSTPEEYRASVERVVGMLREGNPEIRVFVQILASGRRAETLFTAEEVAAYALAVEDLVEAVRIYGGSPELLVEVIDIIRGPRD